MAEHYRRQSALAWRGLEARALVTPEGAGVTLLERAYRGQLVLRGDASTATFVGALASVLELEPPIRPNTSTRRRGASILWLGPDEWLVVVPDGRESKVLDALRGLLGEAHAAVVDASHARGVIGVRGPRARDVLMKGCSVDLHPRRFAAGQCIGTNLARCHVLLHQLDDDPSYEVYVHRSFVDYVWTWLEDAAREYGLAIATS